MWDLKKNNSRYQHMVFDKGKAPNLDGLLIVVGEIIRRPTLLITESGPLTILINLYYVISSLLISRSRQIVIHREHKHDVLSSLSVF